MRTNLVPIEGQVIRIYEEYDNPAEKRQAQRGARHGKRTGKARGYLLTDQRTTDYGGPGTIGGVGSVLFLGSGDGPCSGLTHVTPCWEYLREKCRRIGRSALPEEWRTTLFAAHHIVEHGGRLFDIEEETT